MRLVNTRSLSSGETLARSIYNDSGVALIQRGMSLTERMISRLINIGITYVYIEDELTNDIQVDTVISEGLRMEATSAIKESLSNIENNESFKKSYVSNTSSSDLFAVVNQILREIIQQDESISLLADILITDDYTYQHSLNVAIYALTIGDKLKLSSKQLAELGTGAILHDIGKILIDKDILQKPGKLTEDEFQTIKTHTSLGFNFLRKQPDFSSVIAHCAYQHHERLDGTGYPRGLRGPDIHRYAKIIAIADVFDALTSNRVYRDAMLPHEALEMLYVGAVDKFDIEMVEAFKASVTMYPNGLSVELSDGRVGVVVKQNKYLNERPVIRVLQENGKELKSPYDINLASEVTVLITACLV